MVQVVCMDYPRPELENTTNFLEAAQLSASFRSCPRPNKPLQIVIAGAGKTASFILSARLLIFVYGEYLRKIFNGLAPERRLI